MKNSEDGELKQRTNRHVVKISIARSRRFSELAPSDHRLIEKQ